VRRLLRSSAPVALVAVLLAGCGDQPEEAPPTTSDLGAISVPQTPEGTKPAVSVPAGFAVEESASRVVEQGEGAPVAEGDVLGMQYVLVNGRTGTELDASNWKAAPTSLVVDETILAGLRTGLVDKPVGSQVLVAVAPQDGFEDQPAAEGSAAGIEPDDTLVFLVDLVSSVPARAVGTPVPPMPGLPAVTLAEDGAPTITVPPGTEPPADLVAQVLIEGTGPQVQKGQTITAQYTGVKYADGSVFDSSWANGSPVPFVIGEGQVIRGWDAGLVGRTVGSQVLLIVPPSDGYGEAGQPSAGISGTDTLVFVVDILAAT
jgi:peptidylprolyl isomerase